MLQGQAQTRKWLPAGHPRADAAPRGELCPARQVRRKLIVDGRLNAEVVGQSALHLAEIFGLQVGHSQALQATPRLADSIIVWALVGHGSIAHLQGQLPCTAQSPMGPILPGQAAVCLSSCLVWFPPMHAFPPPPPPPLSPPPPGARVDPHHHCRGRSDWQRGGTEPREALPGEGECKSGGAWLPGSWQSGSAGLQGGARGPGRRGCGDAGHRGGSCQLAVSFTPRPGGRVAALAIWHEESVLIKNGRH